MGEAGNSWEKQLRDVQGISIERLVLQFATQSESITGALLSKRESQITSLEEKQISFLMEF